MKGEVGPVWITAEEQTAGRGRRGRVWESQSRNLAATLLLRPMRPQAEWPQLSFVTAIAAADIAAHFLPCAAIAVKWPNDILADGRKLSGILLESAGDGVAVGVGVNLASFPDGTEFPATAMSAFGAAPSPEDALAALAGGFARWYDLWVDDGFSPIRDAWLARAAGLGGRIRCRLATGERHGVFEGIDQTGALLLGEGMGRQSVIPAADIFFG